MPEVADKVHIKLDRAMVEILAKINPQLYHKYIILRKKGKPVLYKEARKAIYGTLNAPLLFIRNLSKVYKTGVLSLICMNGAVQIKP